MAVRERGGRFGRALVLVLAGLAVASCASSADPTRSTTVVLFDVSNSTRTQSVRARYGETFAMVLGHLRDVGGVLGADVVDANPLAHGELPINEAFEPCTITDNSLDCRKALDEQEHRVLAASDAILANASRGTDVFGALTLAEQFFEAYPEAGERTLVLLSDMVQFANGMRLPAVKAWNGADVSSLLSQAPTVELTGVRVYVVGAGATATGELTPVQIEGIERFWSAWFERAGARVVFYGANLARFPIEEVRP
jgi:hypothetical protein